ncbi:metallophosphoesterase [Succinatimonas hippei]|uniref:metallophosphoesterase n=1 Tax=Succinatimonas hippei TaxID=626938 RepID=UPI0023F842C7|nr:metallophosphoesterase [Succinatimonas hippei]MDM8120110.1 metallophosphoesterase [Succinatimonas hippei]
MSVLYIQSFVLIAYAICSLLIPLKISSKGKFFVLLAILVCGFKYVIYGLTGGILEPKLPPYAVVVLESLFASLLLCVVMLIAKDIISLILFVLRKADILSWRIPQNKVAVAVSFIALSFGFYGTFTQFVTPKEQAVEVKIKNLPQEFDGFRIVQLTDIHVGPILKKDYVQRIVEKTNHLHPDLVVITGDFVDGSVANLAGEFEPLTDLHANYGIYAVTGNHEYYSGAAQWIAALSQLNIKFLNNENDIITKGEAKLAIAGIPDPRAENFGFAKPDYKKALSGLPNIPVIMLAHEPAVANEHPKVDLLLSGHTHGGTMFFLKPLIAEFNGGFVSGKYQLGDLTLYVSNGSGIWSGFSCRVGVDSEITVFTLKK